MSMKRTNAGRIRAQILSDSERIRRKVQTVGSRRKPASGSATAIKR